MDGKYITVFDYIVDYVAGQASVLGPGDLVDHAVENWKEMQRCDGSRFARSSKVRSCPSVTMHFTSQSQVETLYFGEERSRRILSRDRTEN